VDLLGNRTSLQAAFLLWTSSVDLSIPLPAGAVALPELSKKKLQKLKEKHERRGIVYISRIPPHLVSAAMF
jgi:hypothetical protein